MLIDTLAGSRMARYLPQLSKKQCIGVFVFSLLCLTVIVGLGSSIHSRLLGVGEVIWDDYYILDVNATPPICNININVNDEIDRQILANSNEMSLFDDEPITREDIKKSINNNLAVCREKHDLYEKNQYLITPWLIKYKTFEIGLADILLSNLDSQKLMLIIMLFLCAFSTVLHKEHISLAPIENSSQDLISESFQFMANITLSFSFWNYSEILLESSGTSTNSTLQQYWFFGFVLLSAINFVNILKLIKSDFPTPRARDLLSAPLYTWMCLFSFIYFYWYDGHPSGLAIYINQLTNLSNIFLNIGLYVFIGMVLKHTNMPALFFDLLRPWKLAPPLLASIIIFFTAYPTAFTGASGIFILAVGGLIYEELRKSGATRNLSLATTAMSGSMGVILNPCLLIVIIAALNKDVTTDGLYGWGVFVFMISASIFTFFVNYNNNESLIGTKSISGSFKGMLAPALKLMPYVLLSLCVIVGFNIILDVQFNEYSAPLILPVVLTAILLYERLWLTQSERAKSFIRITTESAGESSVHIGALLMLIALSISLGGVLERSEAIEHFFPESLTSPWIAMLIALLLLTVIGMFMDPFGAVILVSATFSQIVIQAGVHPLHFWMVALVAFELGYLSPPVALNHLLTRLVVGSNETNLAYREEGVESMYQRYEKILLPISVMVITLLITAFVPLAVYSQ